jgi:hypothetical protein
MINLNLHGRHPKDLPDKETINDILLELHDTNKFHISWINLNNDWRGNGKFFDNWVERGQVVTCEMDKPLNRAYSDESTNMSLLKKPVMILLDILSEYQLNSIKIILPYLKR